MTSANHELPGRSGARGRAKNALPEMKRRRCRVIVMCSPKGGTGKTTFTQNLLPLMAQDGLRVIGVDLDPQGTLAKWFARREKACERDPKLANFDLMPADLTQWEGVIEAVANYDVAVIDTLPSVRHAIGDVRALCEAADLVLVTTGATMSDIDSTIPWARELGRLGIRFALCMNRANRRELFFGEARAHLDKLGLLCPVEVRNLSDAHAFSVDGLAAADKPKAKARADFIGVWDFVRREADVEVVS